MAEVSEKTVANPTTHYGAPRASTWNFIIQRATGALNAPKIGDQAAWGPLIKNEGQQHLTELAMSGIRQMPPKGGNPQLTNDEVARYSRDGRECILIGHEGHPEVEGTMGQYDGSNGGAIYLVEDEEDVANLQVNNPESLAYNREVQYVNRPHGFSKII